MAAEPAESGRRVDIAHEALITGWPQLQDWLAARREAEQVRRRLEAKTAEWVRLGRGKGALLDAAELAEAERWLNSQDATDLGSSEAFLALIAASRAEQSREVRQLRTFLFAVGLVALVAIGLFAYARNQSTLAEEQARLNLIQALAAEAGNHLEPGGNELGALLARQAYILDEAAGGPNRRQVDAALRRALAIPQFSRDLPGHLARVKSVAFSPQGDQLASADEDGAVFLWNLHELDLAPVPLADFESQALAVAWSPGGEWLAASDDAGTITLWEIARPGAASHALRDDGIGINALAFISETTLVSGSADGMIRYWDLDHLEAQPDPIVGHAGAAVRALAFSPAANLLATAGEDGIAQLWDPARPAAPVATLTDHQSPVHSLAFTASGDLLASGDRDGVILMWNVRHPEAPRNQLPAVGSDVLTMAFAPSGRWLATSGVDGYIRLWNPGQWVSGGPIPPPLILGTLPGQPIPEESNLVRPPPPVRSLAFSLKQDQLAVAGDRRVIRIWNLDAVGPYPRVVNASAATDARQSVAFARSGQTLAVGTSEGTVRLWDLPRVDRERPPLPGDAGFIRSVAISPTGDQLATGGTGGEGGVVWLWNLLRPEQEPLLLNSSPVSTWSVAFAATGDWLAAGKDDGAVFFWQPNQINQPNAEPSRVLHQHRGRVAAVAFAPRGNLLASAGDDGRILLWNGDDPATDAWELGTHGRAVQALAFSPAGDRLASAGFDGTIKLWDPNQRGAALFTLSDDTLAVQSLAFNATGDWLASGSAEGTLRLWELRDRFAPPIVLGVLPGEAQSIAASPAGDLLASGGTDPFVRIWTLDTETLAESVCQRVIRNLTEEEWHKYVPGEPYRPTCPNLPAALTG